MTGPYFRRLAVAVLIVASTLGTRHPAAAEPLLPLPPARAFVPSIEVAKQELRPVTGLELTEAVDAALIAEQVAAEERWYAWEREQARAAAEAEQGRLERIAYVGAAVTRRTGRWLPADTIDMVITASDDRGVDPVLVAKIGACESGGRADAYNASGASGFGQHLIAYWYGRAAGAGHPGASPFDLWVNIDVTAWYLARTGTSPWAPSQHCWG